MSTASLANPIVTEAVPAASEATETDIWVSSESSPAPVLKFPRPAPAADDGWRRDGFLRTRALLWAADLGIAAAGCGAAILLQRRSTMLLAVLWLAFMTVRHTRDGRIADLTDLRRFASINVHFVLCATAFAVLFNNTLYGARSTLAITSAMASLALGVRWSLTRPALRRRFGLSLDERVVVVGDRESVSRTITEWEGVAEFTIVGVCLSEVDSKTRTVKGIPVLGTVAEVADVIGSIGVDIVAVHDVDKLGGLQLAKLQWALEEVGAQLSVITPVTNTVEARATVRRAGRRLIIDLAHGRPRGTVAALKGTVDRILACFLLLLGLPLALLCAILVKVTSPGPVIFRQTRVREHGRTFTMYKLRTMTVDAEERLVDLLHSNEIGGGLFKIKNDPRVTRVGAWLRRLSIDEVPQLWNVVRGDMSLVGPRPALPAEVASYDEWARRRLAVKPGMTGLWQVSGRSNLTWTESVRIDSDYVDNWRPGRDLSIALRTVKAVVRRDGAH